MRIVCLVAVGVLLAGLGTLSASGTAGAPRSASTATPAALIDLGSIFGDENEPDENETDGSEQQQPASGRPAFGSKISLAVVLAIAVLGVLAAAYVANRVRRLWRRLRGLPARARAWGDGSPRG